jgi:hypothetical protein
MPIRSIRLHGSYRDAGKIRLEKGVILEWNPRSVDILPRIPYGTAVSVEIHVEERDYLNGTEGIVWATYNLRQAEIIRDTLLTQNIACELGEEKVKDHRLYLLSIPDANDVRAAIDFIWRENSGLRLKPDWEYPAGAENESFNKWINEI